MSQKTLSWTTKVGNWFLTETGKKASFLLATSTACSIVVGHILPHTLLIDQYKSVVHLYQNGYTVPVPKPLLDRYNRTMDLLQIREKDRKQFKPFMCSTFNIFSAGTFLSRFGTVIGLPINYTWIDCDSVVKSSIKLYGNPIVWETEAGQQLYKALCMPEKAQMYAIAHEIEMAKKPKLLIYTFLSGLYSIATYGACYRLNERLHLLNRSRSLRFSLYGLVGLFSIGCYFFARDYLQSYYEKEIDEYLKAKDAIFEEGGREYFANIVNRNLALRKIMGKEGENLYSALGNENYLFRNKHLPNAHRKLFFDGEGEEKLAAAS